MLELLGNSREFKSFEGFSSDESEEMEAENITEIPELDGQRRLTKQLWDIFTKAIQQKEGIKDEW